MRHLAAVALIAAVASAPLLPAQAVEPDLRPMCVTAIESGDLGSTADLIMKIMDPGLVGDRCVYVGALEGLAAGGEPEAAIALGDLLADGRYLTQNIDGALSAYQQAADLGRPDGLVRAGDLRRATAKNDSDIAAANAYYSDALFTGDLDGALRLGDYFAYIGDGTTALDYYEQASNGGASEGLTRSARLWLTDLLGYPDPERAAEIYEAAIAAGSETAPIDLATLRMESGDVEGALALLQEAADGGNVPALVALGDHFLAMQDGRDKAVEVFSRATKAGSAEAALKLGDLLRDDAKPDTTAVLAAYGRAASSGDVRVGDMYRDGVGGVAANLELAVSSYRRAFANGNNEAAARLGALYAEGKFVERSLDDAARYYQYVPDLIPEELLLTIGNKLIDGEFEENSKTRAIAILNRALERGDSAAAARLGDLYVDGKVVARDLAMAEAYYRQSPGGVPTTALLVLGDAYRGGEGVVADPKAAVAYYEQALSKGLPEAAIRLGDLLSAGASNSRDVNEAARFYKKASEMGVPAALLRLGDIYSGEGGATVDEKAALDAYTRALDAGETAAFSKLGDFYFDGVLATQDLVRAARYYEQSPDGVPPKAFVAIGELYRDGGDGVAPDAAKAVAYFEQALAKRDLASATRLGEIYSQGKLMPMDPKKAEDYFGMSRAEMSTASMIALGLAYRDGTGVSVDGTKAVQYLDAALSKGDQAAAPLLGDLFLAGEIVESDPGRAISYYEVAPDNIPDVALLRIGDLYRDGVLGVADGNKAIAYYKRALAVGLKDAGKKLGDLYFDGSLVPADIGKAVSYWEAGGVDVPVEALLDVADYFRGAPAAATYGELAASYYQKALDAGEVRAAGRLAELYLDGIAVPRDLVRAEQLFSQSVEGVPAEALIPLADAYRTGDGFPRDGKKAEAYYEAALANGQNNAAQALGSMYFDGEIVPRDLQKAADLIDKSKVAWPASTWRALGDAFLDGQEGVTKNPARATQYFQKALDAGDKTTLTVLGELYLGAGIPADLEKSERYFLDAAKNGDPTALFKLANGYLTGDFAGGTAEQGVALLQQAAEAKVPGASVLLADTLISGNGIEADPERGVASLEAALSNGDIDAGQRLMRFFIDGASDFPPQPNEARRVFAAIEASLTPEDAAYQSVMLSAIGPRNAASLQRMAQQFATLDARRQADALVRIGRGNENVYVYLLQVVLRDRGLLNTLPDGQLTRPTIRAIFALCAEEGQEATCQEGPMSTASSRVIAGAILKDEANDGAAIN